MGEAPFTTRMGLLFFHPDLAPGGPKDLGEHPVDFPEARGHHFLQKGVEPLAEKRPEALVAVVVLVFFPGQGVDFAHQFGDVHLLWAVKSSASLPASQLPEGPLVVHMALR